MTISGPGAYSTQEISDTQCWETRGVAVPHRLTRQRDNLHACRPALVRLQDPGPIKSSQTTAPQSYNPGENYHVCQGQSGHCDPSQWVLPASRGFTTRNLEQSCQRSRQQGEYSHIVHEPIDPGLFRMICFRFDGSPQ